MKLGVICDGISRDLNRAVDVMDEFGIEYAELQYVGEKEVGDHSRVEIAAMRDLLVNRGKPVSCLSRHVFAGMTSVDKPGDALHTQHMDALKRVIDMAHTLDCSLVRIMSCKKEQILWGHHGAQKWNVAHGAWERMLLQIAPAVDLARREGVTLVVETGNGTMINSSYTARKLIDDLDAQDVLNVLWDPANNCWCHELAWPDGYSALAGGYLGHIHIKDVQVDTPRATLTVRPMGEGQLGPVFPSIAEALRVDGYEGVVSFESVFHPDPAAGDDPEDVHFEAGFRCCVDHFKSVFV